MPAPCFPCPRRSQTMSGPAATFATLLKCGLVAEFEHTGGGPVWCEGDDGRIGLVLTAAGRTAIGLSEDSGAGATDVGLPTAAMDELPSPFAALHCAEAPPIRPDNAISQLFCHVYRHYTGYINARLWVTGHLWQDRFSLVATDEPHFVGGLRYVALNPVRAGGESRRRMALALHPRPDDRRARPCRHRRARAQQRADPGMMPTITISAGISLSTSAQVRIAARGPDRRAVFEARTVGQRQRLATGSNWVTSRPSAMVTCLSSQNYAGRIRMQSKVLSRARYSLLSGGRS